MEIELDKMEGRSGLVRSTERRKVVAASLRILGIVILVTII